MENPTGPPFATAPDLTGKRAARSVDLTGQTLGDFEILRKLGEGGMGQVYLAQQVSLKRKVALKLLRADLATNVTALARFQAEAEAVAQATHANIVQVYAIKVDEVNGLHYMALEYVEGRNLRQFLEKKGPPEVMLALSIIRQVAAALQRAAELGIIHRDIKPENILLTRKGEVKVADFGLSRILGDDTPGLNLTQSGVTLGTPLYMSPEQVEGKLVDPRTDIYSFGVTCYHLLTGHPPFRGTSAFDVAIQHVQKQPVPLAQIRPDLPPDLCTLVHRMMAKKPDERIQTGREIVREVARMRDALVAGGAGALGPVGAGTASGGDAAQQSFIIQVGPTEPNAAFDAALTLPLPRHAAHQLLPWLAAVTVVLAVGAGLGYGWLRSHNQAAAVQPTQTLPSEPLAPSAPILPIEEKRLIDLIQSHEAQKPQKDHVAMVLKYRVDLGLYYLQEWRLGDAEKTFKALEDTDAKANKPGYRNQGLLGKAMVLAFLNRPDESNKQFANSLATKKKDAQAFPGSLRRPEVAEMVAKALNFNLINSPSTFPAALRPFLTPPAPRLKTSDKAEGAS